MQNSGQLPLELRKAQIESTLGGNDGAPIFKAEGSRGGKVIGHTKSGKPVYANNKNRKDLHEDFHLEDHKDAAKLLSEHANKMNEKRAAGATEGAARSRSSQANKFSEHQEQSSWHSKQASKIAHERFSPEY